MFLTHRQSYILATHSWSLGKKLLMPAKISLEQSLGFCLYTIRAVLSGRRNEVIDLTMSNPIC
jgi:hypothetical protein